MRSLHGEPVQSLQSQLMEGYFDRQRALMERIDRRVIDDLAGGTAVDESRCTFEALEGRCALDLDHDGNHEVFS